MTTSGHPVLVGRNDELERLGSLVEGSRTGAPAIAVISGDAGMGKSALIQELLVRVSPTDGDADHFLLRGGGIDLVGLPDLHFPFGMFIEAIRCAVEQSPDRLLYPLSDWLSPVQPVGGLDPAHLRREQLLQLLFAMADIKPVLLVLEDLQWADESSLAALVFIARQLGRRPVAMLISTRRPDGINLAHRDASAHLRRLAAVEWMDLSVLDDHHVRDLVRRCGLSEDATIASVVRLAEGNPLLAVEMARATEIGVTVPDSIRTGVETLLRATSHDVRRLLFICAAVGRTIAYEVLHSVITRLSESSGSDLPDLCQACVDLGLLVRVDAGYRFRQELERIRITELAPIGLTRSAHDAIAATILADLQGRTGTDVVALTAIAGHRSAGHDRVGAAQAWLAAGIGAAAVGAHPEAFTQLSRGLSETLALASPDRVGMIGLGEAALQAASAARWTGRLTAGIELLNRVVPHLVADEAAAVWERIGSLEREAGQSDLASEAYTTAQNCSESDRLRARALAGAAALAMTSFELAQADALCTEGLKLCGDQRWPERAHLLCTLGVVQAMQGHPDTGLKTLRTSKDVAEDAHSEEDFWRYLGNATFVLQNAGRTPESLDVALEGVVRARAGGVMQSAVVLPMAGNAVCCFLAVGRWDDALALANELRVEDSDAGAAAAVVLLAEATIHALRGDFGRAEELLGRVDDITARWPVLWLTNDAIRIRMEIAIWTGRLDDGLTLVQRGLDAIDPADGAAVTTIQFCRLGAQVVADARTTRSQQIQRTLLTQLEHMFATTVDTISEPHNDDVFAEIAAYRAEVTRTDEHADAAAWYTAAAAWQAIGDSYEQSYALFRAGEAELRSGNRVKAHAALQQSSALSTTLAARPLVEAAHALSHRARLGPRRQSQPKALLPPRAAAYGLTRRELDVLSQLTEGASDRQIARHFTISVRTVGVHVSNILSKLGVSSRAEAAAVAYRRNLLIDEPSE